jgi:hypothetical protein
MRYMMFIKHARDYGNTQAPPAFTRIWASEMRPLEGEAQP